MANTNPTLLLIDTDMLSRIIGDALEIAGVPASKKSACLNKAAARIAGAKHNWGFLTGQKAPVVASPLAGDYEIAPRESEKESGIFLDEFVNGSLYPPKDTETGSI